MAKKVAIPDEETLEKNGGVKIKKKRNCCCTCCLIVLIVTLILFLAAFITGWILGDKYTKKLFGLSIGDTLGVVGDLYWTNDKDVVERPFSKKDLNGFYSEIKRNILLKDSAQVDFDSALTEAVNKYLNSGDTADTLNAAEGSGSSESSESDITDIFVDMIVGVLNRENIDIERLNSYPEKDDYIFNLNDKQLAAFINSVLKTVLKNAVKMDSLKDVSEMVRLDQVVALKQIKFTAQKEKETGLVKASSADVTVWIGLQKAANQAIKKFMNDAGFGWAAGIVGFFGDVILPENLYLTLSVPLYGEDNKASIRINDMNKNERARANKLINGILRLVNGDDSKTLDDVIDDFVGQVKPMLEKATDKMDFTSAGKGTIKMDLLETIAKMASEDMAEGEKLTKADFLFVLQALLSDKTEQLNSLEPYRYDNWYMVDGKPKYMATGGNPANKIDYEAMLIEQIETTYAIDFGENKDLTSVLEMLGISLDGSESTQMGSTDLLEKIDGDKFDALLNAENTNAIKLYITDRMLGAALSKQMDKLTGGSGMENIKFTLEALTFVKKSSPDNPAVPDPAKANHLYALLAVEVDLSEMLSSLGGDNALLGKLVTGLMPENILLTITVDITRDRSITRDDAEFVINSCKNTGRAISTLEKLVSDIDLTKISKEISDKLNEMLDQMDSTLSIELAASTYVFDNDSHAWLGDGASIVMPDIFTVIAEMVLLDENDQTIVKPEKLKDVIRDLNNPADIAPSEAEGYGDFIKDVFDKYYLKEDKTVDDFDKLTTYMQDFTTDKLRVHESNGLAHDKRDINELNPVMSGDELLALLKGHMGGNESVQSYSIVKVATGDNELTVTLSVSLKDLLAKADKVQKLIKAKTLYVTVTFYTDKKVNTGTEEDPHYGYKSTMEVNVKHQGENDVMDKDTYNAMLKIIGLFADDFDIEGQVSEFGVILYEQMQSLNKSMGGSEERSLFKFKESGLELTDFYTFLALKMEPELLNDYTNDDIRKTVQGLYEYNETENDNNYQVSNIIRNAPEPESKGSKRWTNEEMGDLYGNTHLDVDFNGFIKQGVERMANDGEINVEQTIIMTKGDNRDNVKEVRKWLNDRLALGEDNDVDVNADYLAITFSMSMAEYVGEDGNANQDNKAESLFPSTIYATVVYKYAVNSETRKPEFTVVGGIGSVAPTVVFNDMASKQYEIMVRLMGANPDDTGASDDSKVNIKTIAKKGAEVLNTMLYYEQDLPAGGKWKSETEITFSKTEDNEKGMGKIYISKPALSGGLPDFS
ncbi:MAG: hypothetical protein J1F69_04775 [Clostridiales bacterium]|nr:hypothetical protein [Clostridiales bacterium]